MDVYWAAVSLTGWRPLWSLHLDGVRRKASHRALGFLSSLHLPGGDPWNYSCDAALSCSARIPSLNPWHTQQLWPQHSSSLLVSSSFLATLELYYGTQSSGTPAVASSTCSNLGTLCPATTQQPADLLAALSPIPRHASWFTAQTVFSCCFQPPVSFKAAWGVLLYTDLYCKNLQAS